MPLKIYNVLTRKKEVFTPQEEGKVKMYACGITVSGDAHIGHAYQAIVFDMINKYLQYKGYEVNYVRNYTDVDDKILVRGKELGINPLEYANKIIVKTDKELLALDVEIPTVYARATECIADMIDFAEKLITKGCAYATASGDVYFSVASFKNYGKFSNRILEDSLSGVRKEVEPGKKDDKDFALWKRAKDDELFWESPWGLGRPGWHIECSAMSLKYLGETIDIHGGGKDLLFPHHENEIAQSESLTGKQFAKYWIHNGLVKINSQKMSKSLNNGILLEDLLKDYNKDAIRLTLLQNSYRSDINIIDGMFEKSEGKMYQYYKLFKMIDELTLDKESVANVEIEAKIKTEFEKAMDNDFNTSEAFANLYGYFSEMLKLIENNNSELAMVMKKVIINEYKILGILQQDPKVVVAEIKDRYVIKAGLTVAEIEELISKRKDSKANKDFATSDKIRDELSNKGISIQDTRDNVLWDIDFK